jgi:hypothetical protein
LQSEQYFFVGLTAPSRIPQRSQYLISTLLSCFLLGFPVVAFKALVQHFFHPQHLVGWLRSGTRPLPLPVSVYACGFVLCEILSPTLTSLFDDELRHV